jgi:tetratricopeptide (TPR) repeat protein
MESEAQTDRENVRTLVAVARWAFDHNKIDMADQALKKALQLDADSVDGHILSSRVARSKNDLAAAETALQAAHLASPTNLTAMTQLAEVLAESSDERKQQQALAYARLGTQMFPDLKDPNGREAAVTLAWVLSRMKQDAAARRAIEQVLTSGDGRITADSGYHAAQILYNSGLTEAAQKLLDQTLQGSQAFPNRAAAEQLMARIRNR